MQFISVEFLIVTQKTMKAQILSLAENAEIAEIELCSLDNEGMQKSAEINC